MDYTYDKLGQLRSATGKESGGVTNRLQEQMNYGYDAAGNLQAHQQRVHPELWCQCAE